MQKRMGAAVATRTTTSFTGAGVLGGKGAGSIKEGSESFEKMHVSIPEHGAIKGTLNVPSVNTSPKIVRGGDKP